MRNLVQQVASFARNTNHLTHSMEKLYILFFNTYWQSWV